MKMEPFYGRLGRRIRVRREELGWSQAQLAGALTPSQTRSSIANIEAGTQRVLAHTLAQIADVLAVDVEKLLPQGSRIRKHRTVANHS